MYVHIDSLWDFYADVEDAIPFTYQCQLPISLLHISLYLFFSRLCLVYRACFVKTGGC